MRSSLVKYKTETESEFFFCWLYLNLNEKRLINHVNKYLYNYFLYLFDLYLENITQHSFSLLL